VQGSISRPSGQLWGGWHHYYGGDPHARCEPITRDQLIARVRPLERAFFALGERHVNASTNDASNLARALFVHEDGTEPTNNAAERALRAAVGNAKSLLAIEVTPASAL
jgi:hypothetical protein